MSACWRLKHDKEVAAKADRLDHLRKQDNKSREIVSEAYNWFFSLADIHRDNLAKKALFSELATSFGHYYEKLNRELSRLENCEEVKP